MWEQRHYPLMMKSFYRKGFDKCILCGKCARVCHEVQGEGLSIYQGLILNFFLTAV